MFERFGEQTLSWDDFVELMDGPLEDKEQWETQTGNNLSDEYVKHRDGDNKQLVEEMLYRERVAMMRKENPHSY